MHRQLPSSQKLLSEEISFKNKFSENSLAPFLRSGKLKSLQHKGFESQSHGLSRPQTIIWKFNDSKSMPICPD